ncbi:MAG TPA: sulfatase [Nocardioidaceae bacterium]|nr:sulfatase [Nocardioidaceae bacterium]
MRKRTPTLLLLLLAFAGTVVVGPAVAPPSVAEGDNRPNFLLIVADDMAASDLRWMPRTRRVLQSHGVKMTDFLSNHPVCCPARAEILTGQYAHNNGVYHNGGPRGGFKAHDPNHTIATWLQEAGYQTAFVGKYLNGYYGHHGVVPGWTEFNPTTKGQYAPYGFSALDNGNEHVVESLYTADWVKRETSRYISQFSDAGKPFFIYASQLAPHGMHVKGEWVNPIPAQRHSRLFPKALPPSLKSPSFNVKSYLSNRREVFRRNAVRLHRARVRSLQAVDEATVAAVKALREAGELDNTYIIFTSDNGFLIGEHRFVGKLTPYEQSLKIPMLVRGPGLAQGVKRSATGSLIDLAPTFLDLAGARATVPTDGRSLMPVLKGVGKGARYTLVQAGDNKAMWSWRGVRTKRYTWVRHRGGHQELYDLRRDPHQMNNVVDDVDYARVGARLRVKFTALRACSGVACRQAGR